MGMDFFRESGRGFAPKVSIRRQGQIGLSQGAIIRYKIENAENVLLGYDREAKRIGIKRVGADEEGAKKITIRGGSGAIAAKGFLDYFDIPYDITRSYDLKKEGDMLVFTIGERVAEKGNGK